MAGELFDKLDEVKGVLEQIRDTKAQDGEAKEPKEKAKPKPNAQDKQGILSSLGKAFGNLKDGFLRSGSVSGFMATAKGAVQNKQADQSSNQPPTPPPLPQNQNIFQRLRAAFARQPALSVEAGAASQAGGATATAGTLGRLGTALATPIGAAAALTVALAGAAIGLTKLGEGFVKTQFRLAGLNSTLAGAKAESISRQLSRDVQEANDTAQSTARLSRAVESMKDSLAPLENAWTNFKNNVTATVLEAATGTNSWLEDWWAKRFGIEPKTWAQKHPLGPLEQFLANSAVGQKPLFDFGDRMRN